MKCKKHFLIFCLIINMVNSLRPSGHNFCSFWFCSNRELFKNYCKPYLLWAKCQYSQCLLLAEKKKNTIEDIRCNLSQESKIAACTWFKEFFHHSWLLWNSENHELHKCYFIKFDLSVKTWQPAVSQVWEISTSCSKRW